MPAGRTLAAIVDDLAARAAANTDTGPVWKAAYQSALIDLMREAEPWALTTYARAEEKEPTPCRVDVD